MDLCNKLHWEMAPLFFIDLCVLLLCMGSGVPLNETDNKPLDNLKHGQEKEEPAVSVSDNFSVLLSTSPQMENRSNTSDVSFVMRNILKQDSVISKISGEPLESSMKETPRAHGAVERMKWLQNPDVTNLTSINNSNILYTTSTYTEKVQHTLYPVTFPNNPLVSKSEISDKESKVQASTSWPFTGRDTTEHVNTQLPSHNGHFATFREENVVLREDLVGQDTNGGGLSENISFNTPEESVFEARFGSRLHSGNAPDNSRNNTLERKRNLRSETIDLPAPERLGGDGQTDVGSAVTSSGGDGPTPGPTLLQPQVNANQTLFTAENNKSASREILNNVTGGSDGSPGVRGQIVNIDQKVISSEYTGLANNSNTSLRGYQNTLAQDGKPVLHPRTNIFNGDISHEENKSRREGRNSKVDTLNSEQLIGLDRPRANMEPLESTTVAGPDSGREWIKTKVEDKGVNWTLIRDWSVGAWSFHSHAVGIGSVILAVYSIVSIIRLYKKRRLLSKGYFIALNSIMFTFGLLRSILFLVDPYNAKRTFPMVLAYLFLRFGFPCITSAFSILFMALLQTTKVKLISPTIQKPKYLAGIIIFHFLLSFIVDLIMGLVNFTRPVILVAQITFLILCALLAAGYFYIFRKLYKAADRRSKEMMKLLLRKMSSQLGSDGPPIKIKRKITLGLAVKVTLIVAILALVAIAVEIFGMAGPFNVFSTTQPNPWEVWIYLTMVRFLELAMCFIMSYVATQPLRFEKGGGGRCGQCLGAFCSPCRQIVDCRSQEYNMSDGSIHWSEIPSNFDSMSGSFRKISAKDPKASPSEQVGLTDSYGDQASRVNGEKASGPNRPSAFQYNAKHQRVKPLDLADLNSNTSDQLTQTPSREGTLPSQQQSSGKGSRPSSLLISDQGFIRARMETDIDAVPVVLSSTDDELDASTDINTVFARASRADGKGTVSPKSGLTSRGSSEFSFAPPTVNLRRSIEGALDHYNMRLATPDSIASQQVYGDYDKESVVSRNVQSADELSCAVSPETSKREAKSFGALNESETPFSSSWKYAKHKKSMEDLPYERLKNDNANNNNNCCDSSNDDLSVSNFSLLRKLSFFKNSPMSLSADDLQYTSEVSSQISNPYSRYTFHNSVYSSDDVAFV